MLFARPAASAGLWYTDRVQSIIDKPTTPPATPRVHGAVLLASLVSAVLLALASAALVFSTWSGFRHFGSEHLVARTVGLAIVRGVAPGASALVVCLYLTAFFRAHLQRKVRRAVLSALAVPVAYAPVSAFMGAVTWVLVRVVLGTSDARVLDFVLTADVWFGLRSSAFLALTPALWSVLGPRLLPENKGTGFKLFVTWMFCGATSVAIRLGTTLLGFE